MRNGTTTEIELDWLWIRHGETAANKEHRYLGKTEEPLSAAGREQLQRMWEQKRFVEHADFLLTSPMKRCIESADILFPEEKPYSISEWCEMDFGRFEGKNYEDLKEDADYQAWIDSNGTLPFPGGESQSKFIERCMVGYEKAKELLLAEFLYNAQEETGIGTVQQGKSGVTTGKQKKFYVASVVHGGTIMAVLSTLCGGKYFDYQVKNGGGYRCKMLLSKEQTQIKSITAL